MASSGSNMGSKLGAKGGADPARMAKQQQGGVGNAPPVGGVIGNTRRTLSGRYVPIIREDTVDTSMDMSSEFPYTVHIPPTPDNQPMSGPNSPETHPSSAGGGGKNQPQFVSSTMFTGGFQNATRGHVMDKVSSNDGQHSHDQMSKTCQMDGCDGKLMRNGRGEDTSPCECRFKICRDCYLDALGAGGKCPGCKEEYKDSDAPEVDDHYHHHESSMNDVRALPSPHQSDSARIDSSRIDSGRVERRLSLLKTSPHQNQTGGDTFDHARWLYETKGTYGYGNAVWPTDDSYMGVDGGGDPGLGFSGAPPPSFNNKGKRPLSRKVAIAAGVISPYR